MEQLEFIRNAGETRRFHTIPVLREQNIAEHSWHVAMLMHYLYGQSEPGIRPILLMAALCHDAAEHKVGDIPAPAKRGMGEEFPDFRAAWGRMEENILATVGLDWDKFLDDKERRMLKFCDAADGALYCVRERAMGNQLIEVCYRNFRSYLYEMLKNSDTEIRMDEAETQFDREWALYDYISKEWEAVSGNR